MWSGGGSTPEYIDCWAEQCQLQTRQIGHIRLLNDYYYYYYLAVVKGF